MAGLLSPPIKGRNVLILLAITNGVYLIMLLWSIPMVQSFAGGMEILDMKPFGYDYGYVLTLFNELGLEGQDKYLMYQIPIDMLYPGLFGLTYWLLLMWVFTKMHILDTFWANLTFLPIFAGFFDYLENFGILFLLANHPDISEGMVKATSIFTLAKSGFTTLSFTAILLSLVLLALRRLRNS